MSGKIQQPTYKRQRFLLSYIRQLEDGARPTDIQKLVFLYSMKENIDFYEFVPYLYGPYSFQLAEDLDILKQKSFIKRFDGLYKAIGEYQYEIEEYFTPTERGDDLIRKAYREYPYYAINSTILERLFRSQELSKFKSEKDKYSQEAQTLFTIGYEGRSIETFLNMLIQNDIHLLCDIRKNPLSRKFGFSKEKLQHITEAIGIKYVHIPALGIESDKRSDLQTADDYNHLFDEYEQSLPNRQQYLQRVNNLLNSHGRIALMCFERDSAMCHRHVVRDYLIKTCSVRSMDL